MANYDAVYNRLLSKIYINIYFSYLPVLLFYSYQEKEDTILIHATRLGKEDVVDLLFLAGADIEATNKVTNTVQFG